MPKTQKASTPRKSGMDLPILLRMPESLAESSSIPMICGHKRKISYRMKDRNGKICAEGSLPATRMDLGQWMVRPRPFTRLFLIATRSFQHVWLAHLIDRMDSIKPGMTRLDLLQVFKPEGRPPTPTTKGLRRGRFVGEDCPYFKIDVEFEPVARPDIGYGLLGFSPEDNRDVILKVSRPYVQLATTNYTFICYSSDRRAFAA
jgi:hypothetical protein